VIFTTLRTNVDDGYEAMAQKMLALASKQPGFLGVESAREGLGITVSYWSDLESIKNWKAVMDHQEAQRLGREKWYARYKTRISLVERDYSF
jgi:heme-degrading monooxygenase HmoA